MEYIDNIKYEIWNYSEIDAEKIGMFDKLLEMSYRYNPDFIPENIFCAKNSEGEILGGGHLEPHFTWNLIDKKVETADFIYKLVLCISINTQFPYSDNLKENILKRLINRANEIKEQYPGKKIRVLKWLSSDNFDEIDFFLTQGFAAYKNILVMKYDLKAEIPEISGPEGIVVINNNMDTEEKLKQYHEAETIAFSGVVWSLNYIKWLKCAPEWVNFSAFYGNQLVGNTMTWMITEEQSTTEDIFVLPEWRNKGIARYVITEALKYLKSQGKTMATLSVHGDNKKAIALYKSLGYKASGIAIEFEYEL